MLFERCVVGRSRPHGQFFFDNDLFLQDAKNLCANKLSRSFLQLKPVQGHIGWVSARGKE
jgi:hypothetical protein